MDLTGNILNELFLCIESVGLKQTLESLKSIRVGKIEFDDPLVEEIVNAIALHCEISIADIVLGNTRNGRRRIAIFFCAYYLNSVSFCNMSMTEVAEKISRTDTTNLYVGSSRIKKLTNEGKEAWAYEVKLKLDKKIAQIINNKK